MTGSGSGAGDWSEVYSIQPYVIVFDDWRQVRGVLNATLCDRVCDDWRQVRGTVYSIQPCVIVCDDWQQVRGVLNRTLCY